MTLLQRFTPVAEFIPLFCHQKSPPINQFLHPPIPHSINLQFVQYTLFLQV